MNVLSLFDGMSCGQIALERCGIKVDKYFASEIKKHAIKVTKHNYPDTIHIGDVTKVRYSNGILHTESDSYEINIDLLLGGSPCQDLSRMNTTVAGLLGEKSRLFWEYHRIYTEIKRENPNMYFLFENVASAPADDLAIISKAFGGILGVRINSALVSAQMRDRIYWTNISGTAIDLFGNSCIAQPEDKHIYLKDIIEDGYVFIDKMGCLLANHAKSYVRQDMFTLSDLSLIHI